MLRSIRVSLALLMAIAVVALCQETPSPTHETPSPTHETPSPTHECEPDFIGDGFCDMFTNNVEECDYDGGDCCECTCVSQTFPYNCATFECLDPDAECFGDTPSPSAIPESTRTSRPSAIPESAGTSRPSAILESPSNVCEPDFIGDGYCDKVTNNVEECDYDGGDCCECTCVSQTPPYNCATFECLDPDAECFGDTPSPSAIPESTTTSRPSAIPESTRTSTPSAILESIRTSTPSTIPESTTTSRPSAIPESTGTSGPSTIPEGAGTPRPSWFLEGRGTLSPSVMPETTDTQSPSSIPTTTDADENSASLLSVSPVMVLGLAACSLAILNCGGW